MTGIRPSEKRFNDFQLEQLMLQMQFRLIRFLKKMDMKLFHMERFTITMTILQNIGQKKITVQLKLISGSKSIRLRDNAETGGMVKNPI